MKSLIPLVVGKRKRSKKSVSSDLPDSSPLFQILDDFRKAKPIFSYPGKGWRRVSSLLNRYLRGEEIDFSTLPLDLSSLSPFCRKVLACVRKIPYGEVVSYGEIAKRIGEKGKARAVGCALKRNPLPILIPCHRVVKSDGRLGGYSLGLGLKRWLLRREGIEVKREKVCRWKR